MTTRTEHEINAEKAQKPRPDLIPGAALLAVGKALAYGFGKHGRCTWRVEGTEQARSETHIASAWRHLCAIGSNDTESGLPHLYHAAAQLLIAIECAENERPSATAERPSATAEHPRDWPPEWRWADAVEPLPPGWRWVFDEADDNFPWGAYCEPLDCLRWGATPEHTAERARLAQERA